MTDIHPGTDEQPFLTIEPILQAVQLVEELQLTQLAIKLEQDEQVAKEPDSTIEY